MSLASMYREAVKAYDNIGMEKVADVGYSTGFPNFDMRNATKIHVYNPEKGMNFSYYQIGLADGSMTTIIGRTGCGKSTFAYQIAGNIIRPFKTACIYADEIESGMQDARKGKLTGFYGKEYRDKLICRNTGITSENFYERIKLIRDIKMQNIAKFEYNTGYLDYKGDEIYKLEPCVYILDSWALLRPAGLTQEEQISGQMSVTASVKLNTEILRRIIPMLKEANINLIIINHILKDVRINPYDKTPSQNRYLDEGERCPGGDTVMYLANNLIKLFDGGSAKDIASLGINGSIITCKFLKSRTNKAGQETFLVYDQDNGYDPELSLYWTLKKDNMIEAKGAWMCLKGHPEHKFQQKAFKIKLRNDAEFRKLFMEFSMDYLTKMVNDELEAIQAEVEEERTIVNDFYSIINYKTGVAA